MQNLDYGVIGNCMSAALVSKNGWIDWCCLPEFNSSSVFARILDTDIGGTFGFECDPGYSVEQKYIPSTNILVTRFEKDDDRFEVIDFMPRYHFERGGYYAPPDIIRYLVHISGKPCFTVVYDPKLNYATGETKTFVSSDYIKSYSTEGKYESVYLYTDMDKKAVAEKKKITLTKNGFFLLSYNQKIRRQDVDRIYLKYERTKVYWLNWSEYTIHLNMFDDEIIRSALVLKLLTFQKTGAVLAAITTSIPEAIGEIRNWDYRFCWIRDAAMTIRIFNRIAHTKEALGFLRFIIGVTPAKDERIQIMYGIRGEKELTEHILDHLAGYEQSVPVRIGNAAYKQKQHDIYGVLMDVIYQDMKHYHVSTENAEELWTIVRSIVKSVEANWHKPDKGIWEIRSDGRHFTFSKLLCWVAVDRAVKIAAILRMDQYVRQWTGLRIKISEDIHKKAWNKKFNAFTQFYGSDDMDAANLLMESYGFLEPSDPRYTGTVEATRRELMNDGLMYRYKNHDDFGLPSSSFTICNFWLVTSLCRIGRKEEAMELFRRLLSYGNHLGLFSEDIAFGTHRLLGNFPQAYSHLALIESALALAKGTTGETKVVKSLQKD
ncbi:MAG: glycoside hydrolase family 15 protein [Bacteroidales bacterium]